eukprot:Opistho-1_new@43765
MEQIITTNQIETKKTKEIDLILLHGLFGHLSNWKYVVAKFDKGHKVWLPILPLLEINKTESLQQLVDYLRHYIEINQIKQPILVGNSLGGHIALLYTLKYPNQVLKLVLTGSSGLYENLLGNSFPRIHDYQYVQKKVQEVFYHAETADKETVEHVYSIIQNKANIIPIITIAKAAQKQNLRKLLPQIQTPTLLIWGLQDKVTPVSVALQFNQLIPKSTLHFLNYCGHAPMLEQPDQFNELLEHFILY